MIEHKHKPITYWDYDDDSIFAWMQVSSLLWDDDNDDHFRQWKMCEKQNKKWW